MSIATAVEPHIYLQPDFISIYDTRSQYIQPNDVQTGGRYSLDISMGQTDRYDYLIESCAYNQRHIFIDQYGCLMGSEYFKQKWENDNYHYPGLRKRTVVHFIAPEPLQSIQCTLRVIECCGCAERACEKRPLLAPFPYQINELQMYGSGGHQFWFLGLPWWAWLILAVLLLLGLLLLCFLLFFLCMRRRKAMERKAQLPHISTPTLVSPPSPGQRTSEEQMRQEERDREVSESVSRKSGRNGGRTFIIREDEEINYESRSYGTREPHVRRIDAEMRYRQDGDNQIYSPIAPATRTISSMRQQDRSDFRDRNIIRSGTIVDEIEETRRYGSRGQQYGARGWSGSSGDRPMFRSNEGDRWRNMTEAGTVSEELEETQHHRTRSGGQQYISDDQSNHLDDRRIFATSESERFRGDSEYRAMPEHQDLAVTERYFQQRDNAGVAVEGMDSSQCTLRSRQVFV
ncbi:hypothetical protein AB6A40_004596 [Gnathostoma spinigerum]|uniref:ZP domain-containing protein n=1 Tax=Gnathostoma spinigerum TaxID=75299 RepID=A0ABD6EMU3_9BILA